jgi:signal transduction histidine kinase
LLSEITETTRILVAEKPVKVTMMAPSEPVNISTDPIKLRQIVTNLTSNAAKFTEKGCVDIIISTLKGGLTIEVRDTGIGIKEEDLNLIFDAFGQVEDATTKSHEGSGLGLTISNNLANLLGGFLSVTSIYGKGSSFLLTLPLAQSDRQGVLSHAA